MNPWGPWRVGVHVHADGDRDMWTVKRIGHGIGPEQFHPGAGLMTRAKANELAEKLNRAATLRYKFRLKYGVPYMALPHQLRRSDMIPDKTITCADLEQFAKLCALFVAQGVTFTGDADKLHIYLTGGY